MPGGFRGVHLHECAVNEPSTSSRAPSLGVDRWTFRCGQPPACGRQPPSAVLPHLPTPLYYTVPVHDHLQLTITLAIAVALTKPALLVAPPRTYHSILHTSTPISLLYHSYTQVVPAHLIPPQIQRYIFRPGYGSATSTHTFIPPPIYECALSLHDYQVLTLPVASRPICSPAPILAPSLSLLHSPSSSAFPLILPPYSGNALQRQSLRNTYTHTFH